MPTQEACGATGGVCGLSNHRFGVAACRRSAIQAGLIAAFLMTIPLGASFGLGMIAAGFLVCSSIAAVSFTPT